MVEKHVSKVSRQYIGYRNEARPFTVPVSNDNDKLPAWLSLRQWVADVN